MKLSEVAVATMTKARDPLEEQRIVRALTRLAATGMPMSCADASSGGSLVESLRRIPSLELVIPDREGLVAQVRASAGHAASQQRRFILYTEPDKGQFFDGPLEQFVDRAADDAGVGIVVAARTLDAMNTFPDFQRASEGAINDICRLALGVDTDFCYGPFLFTASLANELAVVPPAVGWGWRPFLFHAAVRRGYRIVAVTGDYNCPEDDRWEDDAGRRHRLRQLIENAQGLQAAMDLSADDGQVAMRLASCPPSLS